jgi:hypothetical protein
MGLLFKAASFPTIGAYSVQDGVETACLLLIALVCAHFAVTIVGHTCGRGGAAPRALI